MHCSACVVARTWFVVARCEALYDFHGRQRYICTHNLQEMLQDVPAVDSKKLAPSPLDEQYATLKADLRLLDKGDPTYKVIETFFKSTAASWNKVTLEHVWSVDSNHDSAEFLKKSSKIGNRKLLWHGTNVAVVAAILKGGLRIMPHSGEPPTCHLLQYPA